MTENIAKPKNIKPFQGKTRTPPKKITETYLHNAGLYYLQRFAANAAHFRRVMLRKVEKSCAAHPDQDRAACQSMVDDLVAKFIRAGLLDDAAYLRGSVESLRRRGLSARAIESKLVARGLTRDKIEAALSDNTDDLTAALRLARRRRIGPFGTTPPDDKALAMLGRAGFDYETARKALHCSREEAEEILEFIR